MSANERTGWRDEAASARHRFYGENAPMVNIDSLWLEYDRAVPVALVELRRVGGRVWGLENDSNVRAIAALANDRFTPLPFVIVLYDYPPFGYKVVYLNGFAAAFFR